MKNIRKQLLPVFTFAKIDIRRLFRDKVGIFFVFAFPLIFLQIFGNLAGGGDVSFKVALINESNSQFSREFVDEIKKNKTFDVDEQIGTLDKAREKMQRSQIEATILLPNNFGETKDKSYPSGEAVVLYEQNNQQAGQTLAAVMDGIFKDINGKIAPSETPFVVKAESTATSGLSEFDYTFAGLLGFTVLSLAVFGPSNVFPRLKSRGVLRRYKTTTLKVWQYFLGNMLSTAAIGLIAVAMMFTVAVFQFDLSMKGDYPSLIAIVIMGTVVLFGVGLAIGGWAKNENQAAPLTQIVALPMMFLSGTFFPRFLMPEWLQNITAFIPLTPLIDGVRMVITEGKTIFDLGPQVGLLAIWAVVIYLIAFRVFRWE